MTNGRLAVVVVVLSALMVSCGDDATAFQLSETPGTLTRPRTIRVAMVDTAFEPTILTVLSGETIRFVFTNDGALEHEATFGDLAEQEGHAADMRAAEGMPMDDLGETDNGGPTDHDDEPDDHDDEPDDHEDGPDDHGGGALLLQPGESGEVILTFDETGVSGTIVGCHVPGHWEDGMRLDVVIANV